MRQAVLPPHRCFRAHTLPPSSLPVLETENLCQAYLRSDCSSGDLCTQSHEIGLPAEEVRTTKEACPPSNLLAYHARTVNKNFPFESGKDDRPGNLSPQGTRHDNDFVGIDEIRILPTTDEMLCLRRPYMPQKDIAIPNMLEGQKRHIDMLFRQLRYESTEMLNDTNYHACQHLASFDPQAFSLNYDYHRETARHNRYHLYQDVALEGTVCHSSKGLCMNVSFACPPDLREHRLGRSSNLKEGMLVTLVGHSPRGLSTTFMEIVQRHSTNAMKYKTGNDTRAAVLLSFVGDDANNEGVRRLLYNYKGILDERFVLSQVPGTLYAGFYHTLKTLQKQYIHPENFAFSDLIARNEPVTSPSVAPATYTTEKDFSFQLQCLHPNVAQEHPLYLRDVMTSRRSLKSAIDKLCELTTLDRGQAQALCESLFRRLAFVQGAPGAGKTYLGVALLKVLLASQTNDMRGPIIIVALTNHALDSFLRDVYDAGIKKIARLGSMTKELWIREFEVKNLAKKAKRSSTDQISLSRARHNVDHAWREGVTWCEAVNSTNALTWPAVRDYLSKVDLKTLAAFTNLEIVDATELKDKRLAKRTNGFAFEHWISGQNLEDLDGLEKQYVAKLKNTESVQDFRDDMATITDSFQKSLNRRINMLQSDRSKELWSMPASARIRLLSSWSRHIDPCLLLDKAAEIHRRHQDAVQRKRAANIAIDVKILAQQDVIAMTTTVAARQWSTLKELGVRIVICEEGAEISEASFLASLLPSIWHCICLGDPLQLRPMVTEQSLSLETDTGILYRLDESLMEKWILPLDPHLKKRDASRLFVQRRMHPQIADVLRATSYPRLQDHESTNIRTQPPGLVDRVWWLQHSQSESVMEDPSHPTSFSNPYEVEMVAGLVEYLVSSSEYNYHDITILTPYNGQMAALHARLRSRCPVSLSEQDRETLYLQGYLKEEEIQNPQSSIEVGSMLRLSTIDNFQGEESQMIILSLVRSNSKGKIGFLSTTNRINVAISRARNGFYIIGNAALLDHSSGMWHCIIKHLQKTKSIGPCLRLGCSRHLTQLYDVSEPEEWSTIPSCPYPCGYVYRDGRECEETCHSDRLHVEKRETEGSEGANETESPMKHDDAFHDREEDSSRCEDALHTQQLIEHQQAISDHDSQSEVPRVRLPGNVGAGMGVTQELESCGHSEAGTTNGINDAVANGATEGVVEAIPETPTRPQVRPLMAGREFMTAYANLKFDVTKYRKSS